MNIALSNIEWNPHRNIKRNPIKQEQVNILIDSFKRNDVWPNIVVRPHPEKPGFYQLAYGHNRLKAMRDLGMTEAEFIVRELDDWGMYTAMVDENESQRDLTPEIIYENIESGINLLEPIIRQCETLEDYRALVPRGTSAKSLKDIKPEDYQQVRNNVLAGQGLGKSFLARELPGARSTRSDNIQVVVDSHYAQTKAKAKEAEAEAKRKEAEAARAKEKAAKNEQEAEEARKRAKQLHREADTLAEEARKLKEYGVAQDILLSFDSASAMTEFAQAVKRIGVPKAKHKPLAKHLHDQGTSARQFSGEIEKWWYVESGNAGKDQARMARDAAVKRMAKKFGNDDINSVAAKYLRVMAENWKSLYEVRPYVEYLTPVTRKALKAKLDSIYDEMTALLNALDEAPINITPVTREEIKRISQTAA